MRTRTVVIAAAVTLTAVASTAAFALWPKDRPGADPALWPVETLAVAPDVVLPNVLHVTPAGCPGFSVSSPVPEDPGNLPGSQSYLVRMDGTTHASLWVCLGTTDEVGTARESVAEQVGPQQIPGSDGEMMNRDATLVTASYGELVRVDRAFGATSPPRLTDWLVDHGGYTYVFGYLHPTDDASRYTDMEAMIASVTWDE